MTQGPESRALRTSLGVSGGRTAAEKGEKQPQRPLESRDRGITQLKRGKVSRKT